MELINIVFVIIVCIVLFKVIYTKNIHKSDDTIDFDTIINKTKKINQDNGHNLVLITDSHTPEHFFKDNVSPNMVDTTEYKFAEVDNTLSDKAWSDINVSKYSKFYTSNIKGDITDIGSFFDKDNSFIDKTSPRGDIIYDNKCKMNHINNIECLDTDRLYNKAPLVYSSNRTFTINDKHSLELKYNSSTPKVSNGGTFYNNVVGNDYNPLYSNPIQEEILQCSL
tara:strand:- start:118 stop:789 length:672 start_codon:yes stop_codon:yes gene_type:complete